MHYSFQSYLIGRKRTCRLTDRGIEIDDGEKGCETVPYSEIRGLNLRHNAFVPGAASYRCVIATDRRTLVIPNSKPSSPKANNSDPNSEQPDAELQTYRDFIADLHQRLEPLEDRIRFTRGSSVLYFTSIVVSGLLMAFLAFGTYLVFYKGTNLRIRTGVKLLGAGYFLLACLFPMIQRGKTAPYLPEEIPTDLLPESAAAPVPAVS